jgi:alpha-glucoside transport system substrate-binding protein
MTGRRRTPEHCWQEVLSGEVTPQSAAHLVECEHCARMVQGVDRAVDAVRATLPSPPPSMDERVLEALVRERPATGSASRRWLPRLLARPALVGLATAAVAAIFVLALIPGGGAPEPALAVAIRPLTADCSGSEGPADGRHLLVAGVWTGREARSFAQVLAGFERRTGIKITYAYETRDIAAKLAARIRRGCPPDIALLPQPGLMADLARAGRIKPLDAATAALVRRNYSGTWRRLATVDGRLYGVWFKAADKSTVWYSKPAFRRAGILAPPRTWGELVADVRRLSASGVDPIAVAGADGWTLTDWFENVFLRSAGPAAYDALARHAIRWTDPSVRSALGRLATLFDDAGLTGAPARSLGTTFEQSVRDVFAPGARAAMVYEGDFVRSFIPRAARGVGFFDFPAVGTRTAPAAVVGGDVAVAFTRARPARALMRYLATPQAARPWAHTGGFLSPNRAVKGSAYPDALARRAVAALTRARVVRFDLSDLQPPAFGATDGQGMREILPALLRGRADVAATTRRLEAAATAAFACERAVRGHC